MMDDEKASTIPTMARGLGSIFFAFDTKSSHLNQPFKLIYLRYDTTSDFKTHRRIKSNPLPVMAETWDHEEPISKKLHTSRKNKKRRKVVEARINNMYDSNSSSSIQASNLSNVKENSEAYYSSTPDLSSNNEDIYSGKGSSMANTTATYIEKNQVSNYKKNDSPFDGELIMDSVETNPLSYDVENECVTAQLESLIFPKKTLSSESSSEKSNEDVTTSRVTPLHSYSSESSDLSEILEVNSSSYSDTIDENMKNAQIKVEDEVIRGESVKDNKNNEQRGTEGTTYLQILSFDVESSQAADDTLALVSASNLNTMFKIEEERDIEKVTSSEMEKYVPQTDYANTSESTSLSTGDLKKAIIATAKKKDEVEEKRRLLQSLCDDQQEEISFLRQEIESMKKEYVDRDIQNEMHVEQLNQEIDFLKKQMRKYVSSIQVESPTISTEAVVKVDVETPQTEESAADNNDLYEKKIQQMAEMHGELMEFQDNLQKQLIRKNHEITRLKEQLISLRGPLPDDSVSLRSVESTHSPSKMLINIWIPSVFLKTKGTESFHLYQVYVHVGNDEWNIYRRYSQFAKLHSEVKSHPSLEKFNFPKKKIFGKKDEKLVEKRRHQFQEYLRTVINALIADKSIASPNACKRKLIELLPFFGDDYDEEIDRKRKKKKGKTTSEAEPQYSGL